MVMANPPAGDLDAESAQHVGREFVRQYYTLMHEAPCHLHRFYSQNSSFVHGGVEKPGEEQPPVVGQHEIHQKILSLGYMDCHAKIRQVDSQPTVGNAVVVQVTGELSNNGKPMRRFMQTFVLAPKKAKQYYVYNDVFRYQDEVFVDEEEEEVEPEDVEAFSEVVENGTPVESPQQPQDTIYFEPPISNGTVEVEEEEAVVAAPAVEQSKAEEVELEAGIDALDIDEGSPALVDPTPTVEAPADPEPEPQPAAPAKPCSWAAMVRQPNAGGASQSVPSFATAPKPSRAAPPKVEAAPAPPVAAPAPSSPESNPQPQRATRPPRERFERDRSNMSRGEEGDMDSLGGRRPMGGVGSKYPDSHQLFVGNLPHNISESELKVFFGHWGKVVELRINTKASGGKLPNFGFVIFDSPEPVQDILKEKPIKFNGEHRLNVEEKKPRGSEGRPSGRGAPRGGMGQRGGFGGGRGGIKTGGFGRPSEERGERRGMGMGDRGAPRGGMSGPPRR